MTSVGRLYGVLLRLYPRSLRERYGDEMAAAFAAHCAGTRGVRRMQRVLRGLWDVSWSGLRFRVRPALGRALLNADALRPVRVQETEGGRGRTMSAWITDIRFAIRSVLRRPLFALTAAVTLALGIGANTAVFSIVYGMMMRPLPYASADRLVLVWSSDRSRGWTRTDVTLADAWDWHSRTRVFADLALIGRASLNLTGLERPERLDARRVTANLFDVLGVAPQLGRSFQAADDVPGAAGVAVLSWGLWQSRLGGAADVVGRVVRLDGEPYTIVGVMPRSFEFLDDRVDIYVPLREVAAEASRTNHSHMAIGRLAEEVTVEQASREVAGVAAMLQAEHPETNRDWDAYVTSLRADVVGDIGRQASLVLMGAVGFVLLMACVNVANLLLARSNGRRREMAVRLAMGARRGRLMRQLLTESLVLALAGSGLGVLLAVGGVRVIAASLGDQVPPLFVFEVNRAVLLFALGTAGLATLLFGLVPALRASSASAVELREEGRTGEGRRARRFGSTLIVVQTALAMVLLAGGGIMMRGVMAMQQQQLGFEPDGVLTLRVTPTPAEYADAAALGRFYDAVLERVRSLPGVQAAGTIQSLPLRGSNNINTFQVSGQTEPSSDGYPARMGFLSPGYLEAMRIAVVRGRGIEPTDIAGAPGVALVIETLVRQRFAGVDPLGSVLLVDDEPRTIVGVVGDMHERALQRAPEPSIYLPVAQASTRSRALAVRVAGDPAAFADDVQAAVWSVDAEQPVYQLQPFSALLDSRISPFRTIAGLMLTFAAVSLLLGGVGIYGVTAYAVGRRTHEIGIRIAIGAERAQVIRMILREGMLRTALGLTIGLVLALLLARAMTGLLFGISARDPLTFGVVIAVLGTVTWLAAWIPARRAAALDPVRALAHD
jgi:putative ABC transport system permease protein